jgi:plasmid stabilization system protein ParE
MYKAIILPLAQLDIRESALWYNKQQKGLGKRFTAQVREKVHFIRQNPNASFTRYGNTKTAIVDVFPFMIHFAVNEPNKLIIVSAVFHTSIHPDNWKKR